MFTRITYFKQISGDTKIWIAEFEEDWKLKISNSEDENDIEQQFNNLDELQKYLDECINKQEKNGFKLAAKQTFVDIEHPTVDELESHILLRYKLMGITDMVLLKNARKEALKMLKAESGEREEFSLDTMEFVVDINDHDSLKRLLEWQLENFEEFMNGVCENYGVNYGYIDEDGNFTEHEEDGIETYQNEVIIYREAAKYDDLCPLIEEFINKTNEVHDEDRPRFKNEETPFASAVAFALAMQDVKYLRNYLDYCILLEDSIRFYYDRYGEAQHIPQLFEKYGFDKNEPLVMELIASQMVMRDNQHTQEELSVLSEMGLEEALEDEEFVEALFQAAIKQGRLLVNYYYNSSITGWMARDVSESLETLGLDSNENVILELITSDDDDIPSFDEFQEMIENADDSEEEDDDNDEEDDEKPTRKFKKSEYKQFTKYLEELDFDNVKAMIDEGIPLNEWEYKDYKALHYFILILDDNKKADKDYIKKADDLLMLLINNGADVSITDFIFIMKILLLDLPQTTNYFISQGFDINDTISDDGQNILAVNICWEPMVEVLLKKGANPAKLNNALHSALTYLSIDMVKRFVEEYKVPLQNLNDEGKTPLESISDHCESQKGWMQKYTEDLADPKKKDKADHNGKTPADHLAEYEARFAKRDYMIEITKNLKSLFSEATNAEEQAALDKQLLDACNQKEVKIAIVKKLLDVKANPDARDENGQTPLHHIIKQTYPHLIQEALDLLRKAGAKADVVDNFGRTPLFYFCLSYHGGNEAVQELVNYGIDPAHKDNNGYNALGYLISITPDKDDDDDLHYNCESSIQSLMYGGVPVVDINPDGDTLYHGLLKFADCFELDEMFEFLKKKGVDINAANKNGDTALHLATKDPNERDFCDSYVQKLVDAGANIHVKDASGKTPLETSTHPEDDEEYLNGDYEPDNDDDDDDDDDE